MNPLNRALADATDTLRKTSDTARLDAELLLAHALDIERDVLLLAPPAGPAPARFADLGAGSMRRGRPQARYSRRRACR